MQTPANIQAEFQAGRESVGNLPVAEIPLRDAPPDGKPAGGFAGLIIGQPGYSAALNCLGAGLRQRIRSHERGDPAGQIPVPNLLAAGPNGCGKSAGLAALSRMTGAPLLNLDLAAAVAQPDGFSLPILFGQALARRPDFFEEVRVRGVGLIGLEGLDWLAHLPAQAVVLRLLDGRFALDIPGLPGPSPADLSALTYVGFGSFEGNPELGRAPLQSAATSVSPQIGFRSVPPPLAAPESVSFADFVRYGLRPDLVSRFALQVQLHPLGVEELATIAGSTAGPLSALRAEFAAAGRRLEITPDAVLELAALSHRSGAGARGLEAVVHRLAIHLRSLGCDTADLTKVILVCVETVRNLGHAARYLQVGDTSRRVDPGAADPAATRAVRRAAPELIDSQLPTRPARHPDSPAGIRLATAADLAPFFRVPSAVITKRPRKPAHP